MSVAQAAQPAVISLWQLSSITRQVQTVAGLGILESEATGKMSIPGFYIIFCLFF